MIEKHQTDTNRFSGIDGCRNSTFLYQSRSKLFRPFLPSSACGIDGGPRRFTEVVLNEQSLPVLR